MKIVSKVRFVGFLLSICILLFIGVGVISGSVTAESYETYEQVEITEGDTLWNFSERYVDNSTDVREYIYEVCNLNGIKAGEIKAGDKLLFPVA